MPAWIRILTKVGAIVGAMCLMVGFVGLSVFFVTLNKSFYDREFKKYHVLEENAFSFYDEGSLIDGDYLISSPASISSSDLNRVRDGIIAYFGGRSDNLQIEVEFILIGGETVKGNYYTPNEIEHMVDVKNVFGTVKTLTAVLLPAGVALLCAVMIFGGRFPSFRTVSFGCAVGTAIILALLAAVGVYMISDFDKAFTAFHGVFFPQGNWMFPSDSNMLQILPESLFLDAGVNILIYGLSFTVFLGAAGLTYLIIAKKLSKRNPAIVLP